MNRQAKGKDAYDRSHSKRSTGVDSAVLAVSRLWGVVTLCAYIISGFTFKGKQISLPHKILAILIPVSGCLVDLPLAMAVFHICSSVSWYVILETFLRSPSQLQVLSLLFDSGWISPLFLCCAIVIRSSVGQSRQLTSPLFSLIGPVSLIAYLGLVERPLCSGKVLGDLFCGLIAEVPVRLQDLRLQHNTYTIYIIAGTSLLCLLYWLLLRHTFEREELARKKRIGADKKCSEADLMESEIGDVDGDGSEGDVFEYYRDGKKVVVGDEAIEISTEEAIRLVDGLQGQDKGEPDISLRKRNMHAQSSASEASTAMNPS